GPHAVARRDCGTAAVHRHRDGIHGSVESLLSGGCARAHCHGRKVMQPNGKLWAVILASLVVVAAGAGWYFVKGNSWAATGPKSSSTPVMPMSAVPTSAALSVVTPPLVFDVTATTE